MSDRAPVALAHWTKDDLQRFLEIRQEFFLDPMGSNKERLLDAAVLLQRALFDWYLSPHGKFVGMLALVTGAAATWSKLRKEERRTLLERRFALNNAAPDVPAVESSVSEHQWQKIFGSLGLGLKDPGTFDRFLVQLDEDTNPSLRVNHRYLGELLPHDNMISYLSSMLATFLNENAIIGRVSPCVTHMEQAAVNWLLSLVGWDGNIASAAGAETVPVQRLPTLPAPAERFRRWEREEPTGSIVAGGTIANISALLIARSAVFDYLLGWSGAVQQLGPILAWQLVKEIWKFDRLVVLTSLGSHYSVTKAALQAGVAPADVVEIPGYSNPWILDGKALEDTLEKLDEDARGGRRALVLAVVAIAGKTETGYVDKLDKIASVLDGRRGPVSVLPSFADVYQKLGETWPSIEAVVRSVGLHTVATEEQEKKLKSAFRAAARVWGLVLNSECKEELSASDGPGHGPDKDFSKLKARIADGNEIDNARHNRLFLHVDAAHGGGFLTIPQLRLGEFRGIEHADTITIDGHKSFYCYYPCGGLLVRTTRWAQTFSLGHSSYISEEENEGVYREDLLFQRSLEKKSAKPPDGRGLTVESRFDGQVECTKERYLYCGESDRERLQAVYSLIGRPAPAERSELTHLPYNAYLEGSRGPQGIMQMYFNLATLGLRGYEKILGWTTLLRARAEEAISLGMHDIRLVTDSPLQNDSKMVHANDKLAAILTGGSAGAAFDSFREEEAKTIMPVAGGRFLRLSAGVCNQLLITYVPAREAKVIATASAGYWEEPGRARAVHELMCYLWRVNEHLWNEHIYANPHFTYYVGHTVFELTLPGTPRGEEEKAAPALAEMLAEWNAWTRQANQRRPFFDVLTRSIPRRTPGPSESGAAAPGGAEALQGYARKFFCHKIVTMHPYTDESLVSDMLRRMAFWGERSALAVRVADASAQFFFPRARPNCGSPA